MPALVKLTESQELLKDITEGEITAQIAKRLFKILGFDPKKLRKLSISKAVKKFG